MKKYKRLLIWGSALLVVFSLALSQYPAYYTLIVRTLLDVKGRVTIVGTTTTTGNVGLFGATSLNLGDSATVAYGAKIADTSAFTTTATIKAIYISGATAADVYFLTKRRVQEVSTVAMTDSIALTYMAKTDSLIVYRANGDISGSKFGWFRVVLR
jgi:hypothetical protein